MTTRVMPTTEAKQRKPGSSPEPVPTRKPLLTRPGWHFLVDLCLLGTLLPFAWVSAVLVLVFPTASRGTGSVLWGWGYDAWQRFGFAWLCLFILTTLVHLILQWNWIFNFITTRLSRIRGRRLNPPHATRTLYGVGAMMVMLTLLGVLFAAAQLTIKVAP